MHDSTYKHTSSFFCQRICRVYSFIFPQLIYYFPKWTVMSCIIHFLYFSLCLVSNKVLTHIKKKKQQQQHTYTQTKPPQHLLNMLKTTVKTITFCLPPVWWRVYKWNLSQLLQIYFNIWGEKKFYRISSKREYRDCGYGSFFKMRTSVWYTA